MKAGFILCSLLLLASASAHAQDRRQPIDWKPVIALGAGQAFDIWTTRDALRRGCVEGNAAVFGSSAPTTSALIGRKVAVMAPIAVASVVLQRTGHLKIARAIGYAGGGVGAAAGIANLRCGR